MEISPDSIVTLCCFADENMTISQGKLIESFLQYGGQRYFKFSKADYNQDFYDKNKDILDAQRGAGYWLWKPYFIDCALKKIPENEWLMYCDSGIEIIHHLKILTELGQDIVLFNNEWKHLDWCKMDIIKKVIPDWYNVGQKQVQASVIVIKNTERTRSFVQEWLVLCQLPGFIDDSPSVLENVSTFRENRHDQSILCCLQIKYNIRTFWWPTSYSRPVRPLPYPILFHHHRKRNNEYANMLDFVRKYQSNIFSANGEDGIIAECLKRIGVHYNVVCEFGAADGFYCSNTAATQLPRVLIESKVLDTQGRSHSIIEATVTPENINDLVPPKLDLLSIDIDGNDYRVWQAYTGEANIVVIEINSGIPPDSCSWVSDPQHGTGYLPMVRLGRDKGYFLLCHTGNQIFILNKFKYLFPEVSGIDPEKDAHLFFNRKWIDQC